MALTDFARYVGQRTEPAPGYAEMTEPVIAVHVQRRQPHRVTLGTHDALLPWAPWALRALGNWALRRSGSCWQVTAGPRTGALIPRRVTTGAGKWTLYPGTHEYFVKRLPNWRLTHWAVRRMNRYLRDSGSSWKLFPRARCPVAGKTYGAYSRLAWTDARRMALYLRERTTWRG